MEEGECCRGRKKTKCKYSFEENLSSKARRRKEEGEEGFKMLAPVHRYEGDIQKRSCVVHKQEDSLSSSSCALMYKALLDYSLDSLNFYCGR